MANRNLSYIDFGEIEVPIMERLEFLFIEFNLTKIKYDKY